MKKLELEKKKLKRIRDHDIGVEEYLVLYSKYFNLAWLTEYRVREVVYKHLENLGYLSSSNKNILKKGRDLIEEVEENIKEAIDQYEKEFKEFWEGWPSTDACLHFPPSGRYMRGSRPDTFMEYRKLRKEGVPHEDLIKARDNHIKAMTEESMRINQNKLKYLPAPVRWLKERIWKGWINIAQKTSKRKINVT